jgi:Tfp pilus assembly protein PilO
MLKQFPIKKDYLLLAAIVILLLLGYQLAFKKTLEAWQVNRQLNKQLTSATDLSVQPAYMERKRRNLDQVLSSFKTDTVAFRSNTINIIATSLSSRSLVSREAILPC